MWPDPATSRPHRSAARPVQGSTAAAESRHHALNYHGPTRTGGRSDRLSTEHKAISATFTAFCEQLLAAYPTAPVVAVICDNVIIHRSKIVQRWLGKHPRLQVLHGARYSPHDNPVERIWGALKAWLANNPTLTIQGRVRQVHAFFRARTPQQMLTTAAPHSSPWLPDGYVQHPRQAA